MESGINLMTVREAAEVLQVGKSFMYTLVMRGEVGSIKIGRCRRIPAGELERYIARLAIEQSAGAEASL